MVSTTGGFSCFSTTVLPFKIWLCFHGRGKYRIFIIARSFYEKESARLVLGGITETKNACGSKMIAGIDAIPGVANPAGKLPVEIPVYENGSFIDETCFPRGYGLIYS